MGILERYTMYTTTLYSFWKNISGHFVRFPCNHSYGYALITGILPCTLRARFAHVKRSYDFIGESNKRPPRMAEVSILHRYMEVT